MSFTEVADGIWVVTAGLMPSNSYICAAEVPGGAIVIDVGLDPAPIDGALASLGLKPAFVFCTHGHFDHVGSSAHFAAKYGSPVHVHKHDLKTACMNNFLLMALKIPARVDLAEFVPVEDGYSVDFGERTLAYRHSPGHTPGSSVITFGSDMFTGDTIYSRGVGLSKLPGEEPDTLRRSIIALWDDLPKYRLHPGHGPSAEGSRVVEGNAALRAFAGIDQSRTRQAGHA